jgi:sigma-B regulation protein RsbU (phosphoserine phosphatase)
VLSGSLLAKLLLAVVLIAVFTFLRKSDTEGAMTGYSIIAGFMAMRDLAYEFLPKPSLYSACDLLLFAFLLYVALKPFRLGWPFWVAIGCDGAAFALLVLEEFAKGPGLPPGTIRLAALVPAAALTVPLFHRNGASGGARSLSRRSALPLALASVSYIVAGTVLGVDHPLFRVFAVPVFYGFLLALALMFFDILQGRLTSAVEYYEESVDSLHDLLLSTGAATRCEAHLQEVLDVLTRTVVQRTGADGGILVLVDETGGEVMVRSLCGLYPPPFRLPENLPRTAERVESFVRHARFRLGEGILGEVSRTGKHVFVPRAGHDSPLPGNGGEPWLKAGAFMASPLVIRDRIIGAVSVAKSGEGVFSDRDFDRCRLLADFGSIAVGNSLSFLEAAGRSDSEREADIAAGMQDGLMTGSLPETRGIAYGVFRSSARGVCSDYYDIMSTTSDKAVVVVGDAAGKGVAASVVLVMVRAILHLITASTKDAATLLQWVNRGICGKVDRNRSATLCLAVVDSSSGAVELANAGHQPAFVCRGADGSLHAVESNGLPIGVERGATYTSARINLGVGDLLVLCTDGIVDTTNTDGGRYGREKLGAVVRRNRGLTPSGIAKMIEEDIAGFAGKARPHDDRTVLVMKRSNA